MAFFDFDKKVQAVLIVGALATMNACGCGSEAVDPAPDIFYDAVDPAPDVIDMTGDVPDGVDPAPDVIDMTPDPGARVGGVAVVLAVVALYVVFW